MGSIQKESLVAEAALCFHHEMAYSVVCGGNCRTSTTLVYRIKCSEASQIWPRETMDELKIGWLEKYKWLYERMQLIDNEHL